MEFHQDCPKDKKLQLFKFFAWKLRKILLNWALWCVSRGINNFFYRSSTSRTRLDSSGLAQLKYAFFSRTGRNTKKLRRSNLFQLTIFKHGLLEGSTILLQYSSISRTKLESSLSGELKCAISAGYDVILKNKSISKCKKWHCATYMVTVVWATRGIDNFFLDTATQAVHRWIALD